VFTGEGVHFRTPNYDDPNCDIVSQHRRGEDSSNPSNLSPSLEIRKLGVDHGGLVVDVDDLPVNDRSGGRPPTTDRVGLAHRPAMGTGPRWATRR
jgi:hypothetical protein